MTEIKEPTPEHIERFVRLGKLYYKIVRLLDGVAEEAVIVDIINQDRPSIVYNFNVLSLHTYIAAGCLVHNVKKLASGGIVTSPTLALIGEAGPEAVVPLDGSGFGGNIRIEVPIYLDGYQIARAVIPHLKAGGRYNTGVR